MTVLRLPPAFPPHFVAFAWRYHQPPSFFVSPVQLQRGKIQNRPGCFGLSPWSPLNQIPWWSSTGLPGSWGVLSCLCPALGPRPRLPCYAITAIRCCPRYAKQRRPQHSTDFRGSITRLQHSLSTLPASDFPTLARLASGGWQTLTGWDSNPLDSTANFMYGGSPILSQRSRLCLAPSAFLRCVLS